jgi:hypothetical protein
MRFFQGIAAGVAALSIIAIAPVAQAAVHSHDSAEKVRRLDIMLMVSSLRCRHTPDGFQSDYAKFSANHLSELNEANRKLSLDFEKQHGAKGAKRALDKLSVVMANQYGQGHPWMNCQQLKQATVALAANRQPGALLAAADELLTANGKVNLQASY